MVQDDEAARSLEAALEQQRGETYVLRLFLSGTTPRSVQALTNLRKLCEDHLAGRYDLEVIDIYQQPDLARSAQIVAAPTLLKQLPLPVRRIIGTLSDEERVLIGLNLQAR